MGYNDIYELQSITGTKDKIQFIESHANDAWFKEFLFYAVCPMITYNLSMKTIEEASKFNTGCKSPFTDIFHCCQTLSAQRGLTDAMVMQVCAFLNNQCDERERLLYSQLLTKTLRLGVTKKTVNKAIPGLIPEWEVQQAYPIDKYPIPDGTEFWLTQKLNGTRATFFDDKLIARSGVPYEGLDHILRALWPLKAYCILDGELTLVDKERLGISDNEAFRIATGIINSNADNPQKLRICYTIFDAIPVGDFCSSKPMLPYAERRNILDGLTIDSEYVNVLPVLYHGTDQKQIEILLDQMVREDKEGLMLNTNVPYKRTRHRGILKVKRFYTMDLPIIRCEEGEGRLSGTLGAFVVDYKGNEVNVGSGFTDEQRAVLWGKRNELCGSLCEIKHKEISTDKKSGLESLQFPVFVRLRTDKSTISYG